MTMKILILPVVAAAIALAGCGGEDNCGVTDTGNKVCGDHAAAYCMMADWPGGDAGTAKFCDKLALAGYTKLQERCIGDAEATGDPEAIRAAARNCLPAD